ncbi:protein STRICTOSIDINE SYNTHASE-LIKE 10-like isoform X2 [Wolffia australiana]
MGTLVGGPSSPFPFPTGPFKSSGQQKKICYHYKNRTLCDGNVAIDVEELCGRPLGLQFHRRTGKLYIADAYLGLLVVGRSGGLAKQVATAAEGQPFLFTNGVDVDQKTGIVYFTDTSSLFHRRDWMRVMVMADATGRFLKYNPSTGKTTVLLRGLMFPNGVALSKDGKFALIVETTTKRVILYWLKGPNKGQVRTFAQLLWTPDNIRTTSQGDFWVAVSSPGSDVIGVKMDFQGRHTALLWRTSMNDTVSEVKDHRGRLWLGSVESSSVSLSTI